MMISLLAQTAEAEYALNPMINLLLWLLGLGALACWVMEIISAFTNDEKPLMGILSIVLCSLGGFVIGWIHAKKWGIEKLMLAWTIIGVVYIVGCVIFIAPVVRAVSGG